MLGLNLNDVSYQYKKNKFSLNNINILGKKGEIICLLGPSGCGKSTILKLVAGLEDLHSGSIHINNKAIANHNTFIPTEKRNIALIFQHPSLFPHQTVIENVIFAIKDLPKSKKYILALEILESINMAEYKNDYPHMLSGGQQQLVTIARAIAQNPEIILLDEPFSNLDTLLKAKIRKHVLSLLKEKSITSLMVTHDPEEALEIADIIYVMRDGKVVQYGTPYEIYHNPKDHMLAQFFSEVNYIQAKVNNGVINLPIGQVPAVNFNHNDDIVVCIRPEAIILQKNNGIKAIVNYIKFFNNMIYICIGNHIYHMRFSGVSLPKIGDAIPVSLDVSKVLLFKV